MAQDLGERLSVARGTVQALEQQRGAAELELGRLERTRVDALVEAAGQGQSPKTRHADELADRVYRARREVDDLGLAIGKAKQRVAGLEAEERRASERALAGRIEEALEGLRQADLKADEAMQWLAQILEIRGEALDQLMSLSPQLRDLRHHKLPASVMLGALHAGLGRHMTLSGHAWLSHHFQPLAATSYGEAAAEIQRLRGSREAA